MSWLSGFLTNKYIRRYSRPELQRKNRKNIYRALQAYGYDNDASTTETSEDFLFEQVVRHFEPKVMLDVGANVGSYSRKLLSHFPEAKVYAFEPLAKTYATLSRLTDEHGDRFVPVNVGVGASPGSLELHYEEDASSHASFAAEASEVPYVRNTQKALIDVVTLDGFVAERLVGETVDFVKIDTEGFEFEVLQGARNLVSRHRPAAVHIEFNWHHMFRGHSFQMLASMLPGYEVFQFVPGGLARRDPKEPLSNLFMFSNFAFLRADLLPELARIGDATWLQD
jgi:FkbM family methyltransferase